VSAAAPIEGEDADRLTNTFAVIGNCSANDVVDALDDGLVVRLHVSTAAPFVADHVRLPDGRIAMTASKWDTPRPLPESSRAEVGYGVANASAYTYLPLERSLFSGPLRATWSSDIDPAEVPTRD
jgi:hypothetical protein